MIGPEPLGWRAVAPTEPDPPSRPGDLRPRVHRDVVSFVRRSSRMNTSQQRNWDAWHDRYVIDVRRGERDTSVHPDATVDWAATFGRVGPLVVEVGSGTGDSLIPMAAARPDHDVVAFEVFEPAVASTIGRLGREGVENVRIVMGDAVEGLTHLFAPASIAEIWIFFPDPWHKLKHHKRRLVDAELARVAHRVVVPGGRLRLATDWADYAHAMRELLDAAPGWANDHPDDDGWAPRFAERPVTKYERRGLEAGRRVHDLTYRRLP